MKTFTTITFTALSLFTLNAVAQTPFPVGTNVALAKPGMNSAAKNYTIYTNTDFSAAFTPGATITPTHDMNGIGVNPIDQFVYGASYVGGDNSVNNLFGVSLYRLGADGVVTDLGLLPVSGQNTQEFPNFSAGVMGTNGTYYYTTIALKPSGQSKVAAHTMNPAIPLDLNANDIRIYLCWKDNVNTLVSNSGNNIAGGASGYTELDFSNVDVTAAINAFLVQVNANWPNVYNADGGIQDIAINPIDKKIYGYMSYPSGSNTVGRPVVMSAPAAGISVITPVGTTVNTTPGQEASGVMFDAAGNFYTLFTTGDYAQVDLSTGGLINMLPSNIATSGGNLRGDLASWNTNIPFPVKLTSFTGTHKGVVNELSWVTAMEDHNKGFAIERSADAKNWSQIAFVSSLSSDGNSNEVLQYHFTDAAPLNAENYYRLKQTDIDNKFAYSQTILLNATETEPFNAYPNPAKDVVYIKGAKKNAELRLTDLNGKTLESNVVKMGVAQFHLTGYPAGIYLVQVIEGGNIIQSIKITKRL